MVFCVVVLWNGFLGCGTLQWFSKSWHLAMLRVGADVHKEHASTISPQMTLQYNTVHAHCMLDTQGFRQTLRIRNTSWSSTAKNGYTNAPQCHVIRHCLSCFHPFAVMYQHRMFPCNMHDAHDKLNIPYFHNYA